MAVNRMKFTKHFYIEGQRIVSKLGDMGKNQDLLNSANCKLLLQSVY